jgi:hypothetical protein
VIRETVLLISLLFFCAAPVQAKRLGPLVIKHSLLGAGVGTLVGASAGLCAYGLNKNQNGEPIATDAIYGLVGGALFGAGVVIVDKDLPTYTYGYMATGTGLGAACGVFFAMFTWAFSIPAGEDAKNFNHGSTGAGIGALAGAALGFSAAIVQYNITPLDSPKEVSMTFELQPELLRPADRPDAKPQILAACKMLEFEY